MKPTWDQIMGAQQVLRQVEALHGECVPHGQYELFDDRHFYRGLEQIKEEWK